MLWFSLLLRAVPLSVVAIRRGQPAKAVPRSRLFVVSMTTMAAFDMGVLKFMPAYECLKAIHVRSKKQPNRR